MPSSRAEAPNVRSGDPVWDAIVIGGGPAGSSVATYLARAGRRVLVLERERFPRDHIGESLLPGVLPHLDALGARDLVEKAGFERKSGQTFVWGRDRTAWDIDFRELDVHPYSFFVDRARFDELLLRHSAASGATVRQPCNVLRVLFEDGRANGVLYRDADGSSHTEHARFVIDASGRSALVARVADLRRHVRGLKNVALWAHWDGAGRLEGERREHILTVSIPEGWVWHIPLGDRTSIGIVTSSATRAERERLGRDAWYEATLRRCEPVWSLLTGATRRTAVTGARDWSYRARRTSGPGMLLAGDAACFIDPVLSTGVHMAMNAAFWAAACVNSSLAQPRLEPFFRRFYEESYETMYGELLTQVKAFYGSEARRDSLFWTSKKLLRLGEGVGGDLAFLFITAGLLRNAATAAPHQPAEQVRLELGEQRVALADGRRPHASPSGESPPLVWRVGGNGTARLVRVRAEGLQWSIAEHEPRGIRDRPRDGFVALDLLDQDRNPLALALLEEERAVRARAQAGSRGGRYRVTLVPYPVREQSARILSDVEGALAAIAASVDDEKQAPSLPRLRARIRRALRSEPLPHGVVLTPSRELRGGGLQTPPLTIVFQSLAQRPVLERVYLVLEARVPPELTEIPVVRTRFLDLWVRPGRARDGREIASLPEVSDLIGSAGRAVWDAVLGCSSREAAFDAAEAALTPPAFRPAGHELAACGRLNDAAE